MTGSKSKVQCVAVGLTKVNPKYYGGWDGACPGCDVDLASWGKMAEKAGANTVRLYNEAATIRSVEAAVKKALKAKPDVMILYNSSHGGQEKDANGDEADHMDETICLYDGQWVDDRIAEVLSAASSATLLFLVSDSCHSETAFRAGPGPAGAGRVLKAEIPGYIARLPVRGRVYHTPPMMRDDVFRVIAAPVIRYAGCLDGGYSYGGADGGAWTNALKQTYYRGTSTYGGWYAAAARLMPGSQRPAYVEFGPVTDAHRARAAFR